jgi:hypothetical protein
MCADYSSTRVQSTIGNFGCFVAIVLVLVLVLEFLVTLFDYENEDDDEDEVVTGQNSTFQEFRLVLLKHYARRAAVQQPGQA